MGRWQAERQGLFADSPGNTVGFFKVLLGSAAFWGIQDPSSGSKSSHTELIFVDGFTQFGFVAQPAEGNFVTVLSAVVSPTSRGSVNIASVDPFASPLIDPNFFDTNFDILAMVQAINDATSFISAPLWHQVIKPAPFWDLATAKTDAAKANFARLRSVRHQPSCRNGEGECKGRRCGREVEERAADLIKSEHRI
ncbi:hypothetical protein BXZ70DRAFT_654169 [Cristinia sonorae]|uniref:Glucose-methanol-choline oxidoreductase C-terminal domain-containing protein n=1 Tax=Cristinia sonorae TaxID=1940300 RepID=A0A8K0UDY8_9AGAR|nr:hypothetical protein BXZ70DRAFT_654169 [Cristinia sonorae]